MVTLSSSALGQDVRVPVAFTQIENTALPKGPFATWPPETREAALRALRYRCFVFASMVFDNYRGSMDTAVHDLEAIASICVAMQMPEDWTGKAAERAQAVSMYGAAKLLDPTLPDPNLLAREMAGPRDKGVP
jgi:hypothetical protein